MDTRRAGTRQHARQGALDQLAAQEPRDTKRDDSDISAQQVLLHEIQYQLIVPVMSEHRAVISLSIAQKCRRREFPGECEQSP